MCAGERKGPRPSAIVLLAPDGTVRCAKHSVFGGESALRATSASLPVPVVKPSLDLVPQVKSMLTRQAAAVAAKEAELRELQWARQRVRDQLTGMSSHTGHHDLVEGNHSGSDPRQVRPGHELL